MTSEIKERAVHLLNYVPKVSQFLIQTHRKKNLAIYKKGNIDLVTEADQGAETLLISEIQKNFPVDTILSEESGETHGTGQFKWIIDPLDGTTNYAHNLPLYGISIGLEDLNTSRVVFGLVCFPELNATYHAIRGEGAFRNSEKIHVSEVNTLQDSLFATGFPYELEHKIDRLLDNLKHILLRSRGVRRTGSATLDLCWLAEGKLDGFWEEGLKPWDMAAASIIIEESGGKLTTFDGNDFTPYIPNVIASNGHLHFQILELFKEKLS